MNGQTHNGKWNRRLLTAALAAALSLAAAVTSLAATGQISFSDPGCTAGDEVNVTMKIAADDGAVLSDANLTLSYDSSKLEFVSGTDADGGAGTVRVHGTSNGGGTSELSYNLKFRALSAGEAVVSYNPDTNVIEVYDGDGQPVSLSHIGQSTIQIAEAATTESGAAAESNAADESSAESGGAAENLGIQLSSKSKTITIMNPAADVAIPEGFKGAAITVDGQEVQGWVWAADTDPKYCVVYGMNDQGELNFYRYDMTEKTIQRYFEDPLAADSVSNQEYSALAGQYEQMRKDYDLRFLVICVLGVLALILLASVIYLSAKLSQARRAAEKPHRVRKADWNEAGESDAERYDLYHGEDLSHEYEPAEEAEAVPAIDETQILRRPQSRRRSQKSMGDTMPIPTVIHGETDGTVVPVGDSTAESSGESAGDPLPEEDARSVQDAVTAPEAEQDPHLETDETASEDSDFDTFTI